MHKYFMNKNKESRTEFVQDSPPKYRSYSKQSLRLGTGECIKCIKIYTPYTLHAMNKINFWCNVYQNSYLCPKLFLLNSPACANILIKYY